MKLSTFAKRHGVRYETAWRWFKQGLIPGAEQLPNGTILVADDQQAPQPEPHVAMYARVSSAENRANLDSQAERLVSYATAKGYQIHHVVKEIGSGVNDSRPKFLKPLTDPRVTHIIVEHKDRATRFDFRYLETLLEQQGRHLEVVNLADKGKDDLVPDVVAIIDSFSARLYGQRRAKRKTEQIVSDLTETPITLEREDETDASGGTTPD